MASPNDGLRLSPPWISPAAGKPDREVQPVITVERRRATGPILSYPAYVQDYLDRVTAADVAAGNTSGLELDVTNAASSFLQDLVSISYLGVSANVISQAASLIKAMPIIAGARTLSGALVPVVGPAPTNNNFVSGDYNRKTGLKGNGSTKSLNTNRLANEDSITSMHMGIYVTEFAQSAGNTYPALMGADYAYHMFGQRSDTNQLFFRISSGSNVINIGSNSATGLIGVSRTNTANLTARFQDNNSVLTLPTSSHPSSAVRVFQAGSTAAFTENRLSFYSLGEAIDLAQLDSRVSTLMTALAAAIP